MKKQDIKVDQIYNMQYYKSILRPVRVIKIGTYKAEIQYLDLKTLQPIAVPNPARWGATTEAIPFAQIKSEYNVGA